MSTPDPSSRNAHLADEARALLELLRAADGVHAEASINPQSWNAVVALAELHGVAPLLHRALEQRGVLADIPEPLRTRLQEDRRATALSNLRRYGEFQRVARTLKAHRIQVMPLKGLHLAELVYQDISLRPMSDLDILVLRTQVEEASAVLRSLDYGHDANLADAAGGMLDTKCNLGFEDRASGVWLELHWSLGEPPASYAEVVKEIWRTGFAGRVGDVDARIMQPAFLLLHVCAHLACNHAFAFGLRALCDISEIVRRCLEIDWRTVVEHGKAHAWRRGVAAALQLAHQHLGVEVPRDVLSALEVHALDRAMLQQALDHLLAFSDIPQSLRTAPNLIATADRGPLRALALAWKRVFVQRAELALHYGVPEKAAHLPLFYAVRFRDLIQRHSANAWRLKVADPSLAATAARHSRLSRWINGP